jgi:hypothetical protein
LVPPGGVVAGLVPGAGFVPGAAVSEPGALPPVGVPVSWVTVSFFSSTIFSLPVFGSISTFLEVISASVTRNSTRRLVSLPSGVLLSPIGFSSPQPFAVREAAGIASFFTRYSMTALARSSESFLLYFGSPSALA